MMMKRILCVIFLSTVGGIAQQRAYKTPSELKTNDISVVFNKVKASGKNYFINYKAKNIGNGFLVIDRKETVLKDRGNEFRATSGNYILKSGEQKTIYNAFKVVSPFKADTDVMHLNLNGFSYGKLANNCLIAEKFALGEKAVQTVGDFTFKVMDYNVYSDRVFVEIKCTYNGGEQRAGNIDITKIAVSGGDAKIVKKGAIVFNGKSYTFAMNITPKEHNYVIDWKNALQVVNFIPIEIKPIRIVSNLFQQKKQRKAKKDTLVEKKSKKRIVTKNCALTFAEFTTFKNDLKTEVDAGGKSIELAKELLNLKGCISTLQVLELMEVFHFDSQKLAFAQAAYQFVSDKQKYHQTLQKISYTSNKQKLEEFLLGQKK